MGQLIRAVGNNNVKEVEELLKKVEYRNSKRIDEEKNSKGWFSLYSAAHRGFSTIVRLLVNAGADVDQRAPSDFSQQPETALYPAIRNNDLSIVNILLKKGAKVNISSDGVTPLCLAAEYGNESIIKAILKAGAAVNQTNKDDESPLYIAASKGHLGAVQILLEERSKTNRCTSKGWTALHGAVLSDNAAIIQALLKAGADVQAKTLEGDTPLDIARRRGSREIIKLLGGDINSATVSSASGDVPIQQQKDSLLEINAKNSSNKETVISQDSSKISNEQKMEKQPTIESPFSFTLKYEEVEKGGELGRGGYGIVYQGRYRYNEVAIKELLLNEPSKEALKEFQQEMSLMANLRCPQIVQLYGVYTKPCYGIIMEHMPNGSLHKVLHSERALEWSIRISIAVDVTKGVAFLHKGDILHRDLKSLNVLLDKHMQAKLTDFGLAKIKRETATTIPRSNEVAGTLLWMAPELFKRKAQCTKESDMYSLGMTLWELASRKTPFEDAQTPQIATTWVIQGQREEMPKDTPAKMAKLITFCWDADAAKRPTADEAVKQLLAEEIKQEENISNFSYKGNLDSNIK